MQQYRIIYTPILYLYRLAPLMAIAGSAFALASPPNPQHIQASDTGEHIPTILSNDTRSTIIKKDSSEPPTLQLNINNYIELNMGQHSFNNSRLLYSNTKNAGFSSIIHMPELNSQLHAYRLYDHSINNSINDSINNSADTLPITAFDPTQNDNSRAKGFMWRYKPTDNRGRNLLFTTNYLSGHAGDQATEKLSGESSSVTLDTFFYQRKFHFYGEYAHSQQNTHRYGKNKLAYHTLLSYSPYADIKKSHQWTIGFEKKHIEPNFFSAFNTQLDYGLEVDRLFSHYEKGSWKLQYSLQQQESYFDSQSTSAETSYYSHFSLNYTKPKSTKPKSTKPKNAKQKKYAQYNYWHWLGRPSYQFNHYYKTQKLTDTFFLTENISKENNIDFGANFLYSHWHWHMKLQKNRLTYASFPHENSFSKNMDFNTEIRLKNDKKLLVTRQVKKTYTKLSDEVQRFSVYTLAIEKLLSTNKKNHSMLFSIGETNNKVLQSEHQKKQTISSAIVYPLASPSAALPKMDIKLTGNYEKINDYQNNNTDKNYGLTIDLNLLLDE